MITGGADGQAAVDEHRFSFGYWLRRRRKALDLTQEQLAQAVSCSRFAIRKIEADERRPSRHLAERLAERLAIPPEERQTFLQVARAVRGADRLSLDAVPLGAAGAPGVPSEAAASSQPQALPADVPPCVGREPQLAVLRRLIEAAGKGEGHVLLVEGDPGIGKSRLLQEAGGMAGAQRAALLRTSCYQIERAMPYQPLVDLIAQLLGHCSDALLHALPPVALAEIAALAPVVGERVAGLPALSADLPQARQARLFQAIVRLLDAASRRRPVVLIVDDVHWIDDATAQFLHYLVRHLPTRAMLLVLAYRGEEVEADDTLAGFVRSVIAQPHAERMQLGPLSRADVEALLAPHPEARLRTSQMSEWLHRESEGNPLFVTAILHVLAEQAGAASQIDAGAAASGSADDYRLPDALRVSVRARIERVPRESRDVLELAAVLGRRFDYDALQAVTGASPQVLLESIDRLVKRRLLHEEPNGGAYDFTHDKVREVVYLDIGATRRMLLHRTIAEALEGRTGADSNERTAQLAEHYDRARVWPKAIEYLRRAALQSWRLFAMREALRWFDRAVALADAHPESMQEHERLALVEQRGAARAQAGQTAGAVLDFELAIDAARRRGERGRVRDLLIELGMAHRRADAYAAAEACLNEALAESRATGDERHAADTLYHLGTVAWSSGRNRDAIGFHQEAVEICERLQLDDLVAVQAFHGRGEAYFAHGEPQSAIACFTRSLHYARGTGDKSYESENLMMIGWANLGIMGTGDYAQARAHFEGALEIARAADLQWHLGPTLLGLYHVRGCLGECVEAWSGMLETLHDLEDHRHVRYQIMAHEVMGFLLLELDASQAAAEVLARGVKLADDAQIRYWRPRLQASLTIARLRSGQPVDDEALQCALDTARDTAERYLETRCLEACIECALARADHGACRQAIDALWALADANGMREMQALALRRRGELLLAQGRVAEAQPLLEEALVRAERLGRPRLRSDAHRSLGALKEVQGHRREARRERDAAQAIMAAMRDRRLECDLPTA